MKLRSFFAVLVLLALAASACHAEWRMFAHYGDSLLVSYAVDPEGPDSLWLDFYPMPSLVQIPAGMFFQGDGVATCGIATREVTLTRDFYIGQHEVTNEDFVIVLQWAYDNYYVTADQGVVRDNLDGCTDVLLRMSEPGCEIQFDGERFYLERSSMAPDSVYTPGLGSADHPVKEVTWKGAAAYCDWLSLRQGLPRAYDHSDWSCGPDPATYDPYAADGYRLPTDAEWEYATQCTGERSYPWGEDDPNCEIVNYHTGSAPCIGWTKPVGSYPGAPLIGEQLLYDMAGNVTEFCNDGFTCNLGSEPVVDPIGVISESSKVVHGGSWGPSSESYLRCAHRHNMGPDVSTEHNGFRLARTVPGQ